MILCGMEKTSMVDYDGYIVCTVFTRGCNMRCPFCHNSSLVVPESFGGVIDEGEVFTFLKKRVGVLDGVCITGGEPTLHKDLPSFIKSLREIGYEKIKLDTNGTNPQMLEGILSDGLVTYVAMDIKNSEEKYPLTVGVKDFDLTPVKKSVQILKASGVPFEFRTTVVKNLHALEDIKKIGEWVGGRDTGYFLQKFKKGETCIEAGDLETPDNDFLLACKAAAEPYFVAVDTRGL